MNNFELSFMINKICCSIATTLQVKKSYLIDYVQEFEQQIMENHSKISIDKFVLKMTKLFKGFETSFIGGLETKINLFSLQIRQQRVPDHLQPGETFLGKFMVTDIVPFSKIYSDQLMQKKSIFKVKNINVGSSSAREKDKSESPNIDEVRP